MSALRFQDQDRSWAAERAIKYQGTASIRIDALYISPQHLRDLDEGNVKRLKRLFEAEGCRRTDIQNHVPAIISQEQLSAALEAAGTTTNALLSDSYPEIDFPPHCQLECLHGQHRLRAGMEVLPLHDRRWIVDLYLADLSLELKTTLIEEYSSEKEPDDGEIYRKIRGYQLEENVYFEKRWWARLAAISVIKKGRLERLFGNADMKAAFDIVLDIPGLAGGIRIGSLHKIMGMRCDEEMLCYLQYIKEVWYKILRGDKQAMLKIDRPTVEALQLTAPGACNKDAQVLYEKLRNGEIFSAFGEADREAIWHTILSISTSRLIPSFFSFFEDVNYLEGLAQCVKRLVNLSPRYNTVSSALEHCFSDANQAAQQFVVQESATTFTYQLGSLAERIDAACRQVWIAAMRDGDELPPESKRESRLVNPAREADPGVLCEFASLAYQLGFRSEQIDQLMQEHPDKVLARRTLLKARKPYCYRYADLDFENAVEQMVGLFSFAQPIEEMQRHDDSCGRLPPRRCGKPLTRDRKCEKQMLFLRRLQNASDQSFEILTPFFIRRSVYFAFFGKPSLPEVPPGEHFHISRNQRQQGRGQLLRTQNLEERTAAEEIRERQEQLRMEQQKRVAAEQEVRKQQAHLENEMQKWLAARQELERLNNGQRQRLTVEQQKRAAAEEQLEQLRSKLQRQCIDQEKLFELQNQLVGERQAREIAETRLQQQLERREQQARVLLQQGLLEMDPLGELEGERQARKAAERKVQEQQEQVDKLQQQVRALAEIERRELEYKAQLASKEQAEELAKNMLQEQQTKLEHQAGLVEKLKLREQEQLGQLASETKARQAAEMKLREQREQLDQLLSERQAQFSSDQQQQERNQQLERVAQGKEKLELERLEQEEERRLAQERLLIKRQWKEKRKKKKEKETRLRLLEDNSKAAKSTSARKGIGALASSKKAVERTAQIAFEPLDSESSLTVQEQAENARQTPEDHQVAKDESSVKQNQISPTESSREPLQIEFTAYENGRWLTVDTLPLDRSQVRRVALKYERKQFLLFDTKGTRLRPGTCFDHVLNDRSYTIVLGLGPGRDTAKALTVANDSTSNAQSRKRNR